MSMLAIVGNVLWLIFGPGIVCFVFWVLAGGLLAITVVGLPFAVAAFRIARFAALPFGQRLVDARELGHERIAGTSLANALWVVLAGIWLALAHALLTVAYLITIIGIPFALAHWRLAAVSLAPLGKRAAPS